MSNILDDYINDLLKINPTINDFFLKDGYENKKHIQPNVYSEKHYKQMNDLNKLYLKRVNKKSKLSFHEKIFKQDLKDSIHLEEGYQIYYYMPIDIRGNIIIDYVTECSGNGFFKFKKKKDYYDFISRLKSLDDITDEVIYKMKLGIKDGFTLYEKTVDYMIYQNNEILKKKPYENNKVTISKKKWNEAVQKYLVKNIEKLNNFLIKEYHSHSSNDFGLQSYKGGKDAYRYMVKMDTLRTATPEKIHEIGIQELKRLLNEKKKLEKKINKGDIDKYIKNEKKDYYVTKKAVLDDLKEIKKDIIYNIFSKNFHGEIKKSDDYDIKSIGVENESHYAYYLSADLKKTKKGAFYINTKEPDKINKNELYVLSLHEGIPGHHYEINYHNHFSKYDYFKWNSYNSYSEGWGLYCESLGDYSDDKKYYYRLKYNILRSLRLIIDTAIHYFGWEYNRCFDFMKKYLDNSDKEIHRSLLRYISNPGQALTYKIGERTILYLREKYMREGGNIKDFHEIIMKLGPCPLDDLIDGVITFLNKK